MDWLCTPLTLHSTRIAPSSTRSALSTCTKGLANRELQVGVVYSALHVDDKQQVCVQLGSNACTAGLKPLKVKSEHSEGGLEATGHKVSTLAVEFCDSESSGPYNRLAVITSVLNPIPSLTLTSARAFSISLLVCKP